MKLTEIDDAWTNIHGIHDNGRDHGVWRLTLTAYSKINNFSPMDFW